MNKKNGVYELKAGGAKHILKFGVNTFIRLRDELSDAEIAQFQEKIKVGDLKALTMLIKCAHDEATRQKLNKKELKDLYDAGDILNDMGKDEVEGMFGVMMDSRFLSEGAMVMQSGQKKKAPAKKSSKK